MERAVERFAAPAFVSVRSARSRLVAAPTAGEPVGFAALADIHI